MNKRHTILIISEDDYGGELIETQLIYNELIKRRNLLIKRLILNKVDKSGIIDYFFWIVKSAFISFKEIIKNKPDSIYTTTFLPIVPCLVIKNRTNVKIVYHYHGDRIPPKQINLNFLHRITQSIKYYLIKFEHNLIIYKSDLIFVPSIFSKKYIINAFPNVYSKKIQIVNNGIEIEKYRYQSLKFSKEYKISKGVNEKKKILLSVGRLNIHKGFLELVESFKYINKQFSGKCILVLMTPFPHTPLEMDYKSKLLKTINNFHLRENVLLIQGKTHLAEYYRFADLFISLSNIENFPLTLIESYSSGLIYCSRPVGGLTDMVGKIDNRLLLKSCGPEEVACEICKILQLSIKDKKTIITKQFKKVEDFNITNTAQKIISLIYSE